MPDNWSTEYKQSVVNELNELRESLAECQHGNDKLREAARKHRQRIDKLAAERNRYREQAGALAEALQAIYDDITAKSFSRTTFGEYREGAICGDLIMEHAKTALGEWDEKQLGCIEAQYQAHVDL
jgi:DNA repair exonuclease SbcCD ATPase subunit